MTPESPAPPPPFVALGIIIEAPFLPQLLAPLSMNTHLTSSMLASPADSVTTFVSGGPGILLSSSYTAGAATKQTQHHYTPPDVSALIAALEERCAKLTEAREAARKIEVQKQLDQALAIAHEDLAELKGGKAPVPALSRTTFVESSEGDVTIFGEIIYEYSGPNIVESMTTSRTDESPPNVQVGKKTYEYDLMGRLTAMVEVDQPTKYIYDPGGRVLSANGEFSSPEGDFKVTHRTMYVYAPPQSPGPIPGNAIMSSVNESRSGPTAVLQADRAAMDLPPLAGPEPPKSPAQVAPTADQLDIPAPPGLPKPKGLDPTNPKLEFTTAMSVYVYP